MEVSRHVVSSGDLRVPPFPPSWRTGRFVLEVALVKTKARELGFDACGVAGAAAHPELAFFREWLARGHAGEMGWLARSAERRADVRNVVPGARAVIVTATVYNTD